MFTMFLACVAASAVGSEEPLPGEPYVSVTNTYGSFTNFNVEVLRGLDLESSSEVFAINAYQSTLLRFEWASEPTGVWASEPTGVWRTLTNPVSVALHKDGGATDVYVVGQGNHALARHAGSGKDAGLILDVLMLPAEPADIAIDRAAHLAYISCMGDDAVVEVALPAPGANPTGNNRMKITRIWSWQEGLELKRPRWLHLDAESAFLYVAPFISGNNTLVTSQAEKESDQGVLLNGNDSASFEDGGLPDNDLFRINLASGEVEPMVRGVGSLILAHGFTPSRDYWILAVEHHNAEVGNELEARGAFASNVLHVVKNTQFPADGSALDLSNGPIQAELRVDLDDSGRGTGGSTGETPEYKAETSVPFPSAFEFVNSGEALIASSMNPALAIVDGRGGLGSSPLPPLALTSPDPDPEIQGRVPRTVRYAAPWILVYCQQTSNILIFHEDTLHEDPRTGPIGEMLLGSDPTPETVRRGRDIWYDASRSQHGRTSCNTCHPQGGADGLVWRIADVPVDDKGPMVTQPLLGIEDTFPYHWRGERDLAAFNVAFEALLGGTQLDELAEENGLKDFMDFVFSLVPPANPLQAGPLVCDPGSNGECILRRDFHRRLQEESALPSAIEGSRLFHLADTDRASTGEAFPGACVNCHSNPTGSNGEFNVDAFTRFNRRNNFKVAHLDNQLSLKRQPLVDVTFKGTTISSNLLGSGTSHDGRMLNTFDFVRQFESPTDEEVAALTAFLDVFDTGTAPAVHYAVKLDKHSDVEATARDIERWLLDQAEMDPPWVGVVVIGRFPVGKKLERIHWYYDAASQLFRPDDPTLIDPQPLSAFEDMSAAGPKPDNVFLGVPPGNEIRLGIDWDGDGLDTAGEKALTHPTAASLPTEIIADIDDDGFPDGYEVLHGSEPEAATPGPSVETTLPALVERRLDFVNATQAKFTFRTDEPVTWKLEVTPSDPALPTVSTEGRNFDTVHTAVIHKLVPSTKFDDRDGVHSLEQINTYRATLVLTDLSGIVSPEIPLSADLGNDLFATTSLIRIDVPCAEAGPGADCTGFPDNEAERELVVVGEKECTKLDAAENYDYEVRLRIDYREETPHNRPAADHVVVAQLLQRTRGTLDWQVVPRQDILEDTLPEGETEAINNVLAFMDDRPRFLDESEPGCRDLAYSPPFPFECFHTGQLLVLQKTASVCPVGQVCTDSEGWTGIRFRVENLSENQELGLNVLAVIPEHVAYDLRPVALSYDPTEPTFFANPGGNALAFNAYHFPATQKENRTIVPNDDEDCTEECCTNPQ